MLKIALIFWLAVTPPIIPQKIAIGPFNSVGECETAFAQAMQHYIGVGQIAHECKQIS